MSPAEEYASVYEMLQRCRETGQGQAAGILSARLRALGEGFFEPLPATKKRQGKVSRRPRTLAHPSRSLCWWKVLRWSR